MMGSRAGGISAIKLALMAKEARAEAKAALLADPIAVVGMACRVPGADDPDAFWRLLASGADAIGPVPADRWDAGAWYDPDLSAQGKSLARAGGFLASIDGFDADYFAIPGREADRMDPQQRLFLEVACDAIDDAGLPHPALRGSRTGVFVASYHNDYAMQQLADVDGIELRTLTGTLHSVLANRLSYLLDLRGPSLSLDTACSSSLVAVHLACQSLRLGESDIALAGGVSLMIGPELMVALSKVGFMAPDGRCKPFDAAADGFGRGEGCGVVVLKRLSDAVADRDRVLAVIRGTVVNQDGHSTLLTAPNGPAQEDMVRQALSNARLDPGRIGFVETHGTGTALGDPIEVEALASTIGREPDAETCWLGSVKANIGHLEAAAGVAGLIKAILALRNEAIPPQPRFGALNPHICLDGTRLAVPTSLVAWPRGPAPRCAGVSSFGVGGTNAHVIVEEAPVLPAEPAGGEAPWVLPLSAATPAALAAHVAGWSSFLAQTHLPLSDICHTAALRRTHHASRVAVWGRSRADLERRLRDTLPGLPSGTADRRGGVAPRVAFVFSGQGPQWFAMGRELMACEPAYRQEIEACDRALTPLAGWSLIEELERDEPHSRLGQTEVAQPAIFALQSALVALWRQRGVVPAAVCGHSVGEIAALHAAGCLDRDEALRIVLHRGRTMQRATGLGRMAAVALDEAAASELVRPYGPRLGIGAVNGPRSIVLSGDTAAVEEAVAAVRRQGIACSMLPVQYAFHSEQMAPFETALSRALGSVVCRAPSVPVYSTVTGARVDRTPLDAAYFGRGIRAPVRFASAVRALLAEGCDVLLEIGPHPVLATALSEILEASGATAPVIASLRRGRPEADAVAEATARLYAAGCDLDWARVAPSPGNVCALPAYPWQRKRHWLPPRRTSEAPAPGAAVVHPLLGHEMPVAGLDACLFAATSRLAAGWLADHRVFDRVIVPAAAMMEAFAVAAARALGRATAQISDFAVHQPLPIADAEAARWQVVAKRDGAGGLSLEWHLAAGGDGDGEWQLIASARASAPGAPPAGTASGEASEPVAAEAVYAGFERLGVVFGPAFRCLADIRLGSGRASARIVPSAAAAEAGAAHRLHPVLLDAALQLCSLAAGPSQAGDLPRAVYLPMAADRVLLAAEAHGDLVADVALRPSPGEGALLADVRIATPEGSLVASIDGMRFIRSSGLPAAARSLANDVYDIAWEDEAADPAAAGEMPRRWLLLAQDGGLRAGLVQEIGRRGGACHCATPSIGTIAGCLREATARLGAAPDVVVHAAALADVRGEDPAAVDAPPATLIELVKALASQGPSPRLAILTRGARRVVAADAPEALSPRAAALWGLQRVIALEHPDLASRWIDLDASVEADPARLCAEIAHGAGDATALRHGRRLVPRLVRRALPSPGAEATPDVQQLHVARPGTIDGLAMRSAPRPPLRSGEVRLAVEASGLNFRDVLLALGMYPGPAVPLGAECAGIVTEVGEGVRDFAVGARVMGMVPATLATEVVADARQLVPVPSGLAPVQAAALPVAYMTAHYGLHRLAGLRAGMSVLVHAGAGGVGMAAIGLALRAGAVVYATAGSPEKRGLLQRLGVRMAMDSRSLAFADELREATGGRGVDVVLNSLAGEFIPAGLDALARGGCFLELGKRGVWTPGQVAARRPDVRYHVYDLGQETAADPAVARAMLADVVAGLADDTLQPLPVTPFPLGRAADAMRHMAQARHVGKIVITVEATAARRSLCRADASYLVTGGLGALGLATARWLVARGARHLVLAGRRPPSPASAEAIEALRAGGAEIVVLSADVSDRGAVAGLLATIAERMPPLRGIVHAAGATRDGLLVNQSWSDAREVLRGKADGAFHLDALTEPIALDFFVLYSAAAFVLGGSGQGVYAAANAELDALAEQRRARGLPGLSVAWGAWGEAGMAAELAKADPQFWLSRGIGMIGTDAAFACLERLIASGRAYAAVLPIDWRRFIARAPRAAVPDLLLRVVPQAKAEATEAAVTVAATLQALPQQQRREALVDHLAGRVRAFLDLAPAAPVDPDAALKDLGVDSLTAVELRNALVRSGGRPLPATLLFDYPTLARLADHLMQAWALGPKANGAKAPVARAPALQRQVETLSEEEAEALLLQELEAAAPGGRT
ncbi:MAG: type I polyketide synthase [Hyphomicrobiaceae bacterium]|nr:type I polyketide synthase [Hyphomicrobiaceae bacterium]